MKIKIGDVTSFSSPTSVTYKPDDRQQLVEVEGGNIVQDYGVIDSGLKVTMSVKFTRDEFAKLWEYFTKRTLVNFTDSAGVLWESTRVRVISYSYEERFESIINAEIEMWRI